MREATVSAHDGDTWLPHPLMQVMNQYNSVYLCWLIVSGAKSQIIVDLHCTPGTEHLCHSSQYIKYGLPVCIRIGSVYRPALMNGGSKKVLAKVELEICKSERLKEVQIETLCEIKKVRTNNYSDPEETVIR